MRIIWVKKKNRVPELNRNLMKLAHLCRMYFPTLINLTSRPFPILGLLGDIFHFY